MTGALETLEKEQADRAGSGAEESFCRYFSAKEGLAIVYQQVGLAGLALSVYAELEEEFENLCADSLKVDLFGGIEGPPEGASVGKAAALAEAAVGFIHK